MKNHVHRNGRGIYAYGHYAGLAYFSSLRYLSTALPAIRRLEASKHLNAGVGGYLQLDGRVRMDASIMKDDFSAGAVVGIEDVEHPI